MTDNAPKHPKYPPVTGATPETLAQSLVRHKPTADDHGLVLKDI